VQYVQYILDVQYVQYILDVQYVQYILDVQYVQCILDVQFILYVPYPQMLYFCRTHKTGRHLTFEMKHAFPCFDNTGCQTGFVSS